jgi:hypothetical protein
MDGRGTLTALLAVPAFELLDHSGGIDELLLPGVKRVAGATDLEPQLLLGRPCIERVPAGATNFDVVILGVDSTFHDTPPLGSSAEDVGFYTQVGRNARSMFQEPNWPVSYGR